MSRNSPNVHRPPATAAEQRQAAGPARRAARQAGASCVRRRGTLAVGVSGAARRSAVREPSPYTLAASGRRAARACRRSSSRFSMIDSFERSSSARISSRDRARRALELGSPSEKRPQPVADIRRKHPLEILERRAAECRIVGVQAAIRDLQRRGRQHQRQQREHVRQALSGAVLEELVHERRLCPRRSDPAAGGSPRPAGRPPPRGGPRRRYARVSMRIERVLRRRSPPATGRTGSAPRTAGRPGRAAGRPPLAARRRPRTRAPAGGGRQTAGWGRSARRSARRRAPRPLLRSARTASSATGSHASSGMHMRDQRRRQALLVAAAPP